MFKKIHANFSSRWNVNNFAAGMELPHMKTVREEVVWEFAQLMYENVIVTLFFRWQWKSVNDCDPWMFKKNLCPIQYADHSSSANVYLPSFSRLVHLLFVRILYFSRLVLFTFLTTTENCWLFELITFLLCWTWARGNVINYQKMSSYPEANEIVADSQFL